MQGELRQPSLQEIAGVRGMHLCDPALITGQEFVLEEGRRGGLMPGGGDHPPQLPTRCWLAPVPAWCCIGTTDLFFCKSVDTWEGWTGQAHVIHTRHVKASPHPSHAVLRLPVNIQGRGE